MNIKNKIVSLYKIWKLKQVYDDYHHEPEQRKNKRKWSRKWLLRRDEMLLGVCSFVHNELSEEDPDSYKNYLRMDAQAFNILHSLVEDKIKRMDTVCRQAIPSKFRLTVTLRFLATGESFISLSYSTRIAVCTISQFVPEVLQAIYDVLQEQYLKVPSTQNVWLQIASEFEEQWNIPNTIGSIDGKHVCFRAPRSAGSHYYNYKGTHSIVLMAIVDANYRFLYIDVGCNGRVSDGGVYAACDFNLALEQETLNIPADKPLPGMETAVPYVLLADAAFPLQDHIMKPYPFRNMTREQRIFNYRLSRARRVVENAFGILANRFRVLLNPINLQRDKVVLITQACCALHNFLIKQNPKAALSEVDVETANGQIENGSWRQGDNLNNVQFRRRRPTNHAISIRETFKEYFNNLGTVEWQDAMI